jgi:hypothetical protein
VSGEPESREPGPIDRHRASYFGLYAFASAVGCGGGIWLSLLRDRMGFSVGLAHSTEGDIIYFKAGFSY